MLERTSPDEYGRKDRLTEEVTKPRQGVVVDAVAVDPVAEILDAAKQKGDDWLLFALEKLSGIPLGALPPADLMDAAAPHDDAGRVHGAEGRRNGPPASPAARQRHDPA